jgi:outer membrane protein assembly factor BamD (BamD/ComL family)
MTQVQERATIRFITAYAARQGVDLATYLKGLGPALTPVQAGGAIVDLASGPDRDQGAYLRTTAGLSPVRH